MKKKGKIFIITGPSGVGKTEIAKSILKKKNLRLKRVVTCTTRPPRKGEINGKDYFFLTKEEFLKNINKNAMFEYAKVYENYYGSRKKDVYRIINMGNNVLFVVDVRGAFNIKRIDKAAQVVFIKAESISELKQRLIGRNKDSNSIIHKRLNFALRELKQANKFDHVVINHHGKLLKAVIDVAGIIKT